MMPEIGIDGQKRLSKARVLIVGVGGIGSPAALYLAMAGVGTLGLVDSDTVDISNLNRQILYCENVVGQNKVAIAAEQLRARSSQATIVEHCMRLTSDNARQLAEQYDIVVDGSDNYETRYALSDACAELDRPFIYGAIQGFEGQVAVLCSNGGRTYRDLFPSAPATNSMQKAVVGPTAGIVGCFQANEVIKLICGIEGSLTNRLLSINLQSMQTFVIDL